MSSSPVLLPLLTRYHSFGEATKHGAVRCLLRKGAEGQSFFSFKCAQLPIDLISSISADLLYYYCGLCLFPLHLIEILFMASVRPTVVVKL